MNNKEDPKMVLNQIESLLLLYNRDLSPQNPEITKSVLKSSRNAHD